MINNQRKPQQQPSWPVKLFKLIACLKLKKKQKFKSYFEIDEKKSKYLDANVMLRQRYIP